MREERRSYEARAEQMVAELTAQMRGGLEAAVAKVRALDAELVKEKAESAALRARLAQQERARADEEEEDDEDEDDEEDDDDDTVEAPETEARDDDDDA